MSSTPFRLSNPQGRTVKPAHGVTSLTLTINDGRYAVWKIPVAAGTASECFELKKKGSSDRYHVSQHAYGVECTCGDFIFRRNHIDEGGCKHVRALAVFGLVTNHPAPIRGGAPERPPFDAMPRRVRRGQTLAPSAMYTEETDGPGLSTSLVGHAD
jgi:hypothetical protein